MIEGRLKAVVIRIARAQKQGRRVACDMREVINIAGSLAKKREGVQHDIPIVEILFSAKLGVYVAIYEVPSSGRRMASQRRSERERDGMI